MDKKEIFETALKYFSNQRHVNEWLLNYAEVSLVSTAFDVAQNYANMVLETKTTVTMRVQAWKIKLFARLQCKNEDEFYHNSQFGRSVPEYRNMIKESSSDEELLKKIIKMADKNAAVVMNDRKIEETKKLEERRIAEEEKRHIEKEKQALVLDLNLKRDIMGRMKGQEKKLNFVFWCSFIGADIVLALAVIFAILFVSLESFVDYYILTATVLFFVAASLFITTAVVGNVVDKRRHSLRNVLEDISRISTLIEQADSQINICQNGLDDFALSDKCKK